MARLNGSAVKVLLVALTAACPFLAFAENGPSGGGGGDPKAQEFLAKMTAVSAWLLRANTPISDIDARRSDELVKQFAALMDDQTQTPIDVKPGKLHDESGAEKPALYSKKPLLIRVDKDAWDTQDSDEKFVTAGLELFGLLGIPKRYGTAELIRGRVDEIQKFGEIAARGWGFKRAVRASDITTYFEPGIWEAGSWAFATYPVVINYNLYLNDMVNYFRHTAAVHDQICKAYGHSGAVSYQNSEAAPRFHPQGAEFRVTGYVGMAKTHTKMSKIDSISCR